MHEMILCKLGEVVLKGLNRRSFEDKLMANVNRRVAKCGNFRIYAKQSTIYVEPKDENCDIDAAFEGCKKVFGIIAVSKALPCEKDVQKIIAAAKEYLACDMRTARSFKVESKRADKTFPLTSTTPSSSSTLKFATTRPTFTAPRKRVRAACPSAWAAWR